MSSVTQPVYFHFQCTPANPSNTRTTHGYDRKAVVAVAEPMTYQLRAIVEHITKKPTAIEALQLRHMLSYNLSLVPHVNTKKMIPVVYISQDDFPEFVSQVYGQIVIEHAKNNKLDDDDLRNCVKSVAYDAAIWDRNPQWFEHVCMDEAQTVTFDYVADYIPAVQTADNLTATDLSMHFWIYDEFHPM